MPKKSIRHIAILISTLCIAQGCSLVPPTKENMKTKISENDRQSSITFSSSTGKFGYLCTKFSQFKGELKSTTFSAFEYRFPFVRNIQGANVYDQTGVKIDITKTDSLQTLTSTPLLYVDWKGREKFMPRYELSLDNSIVKKFISKCESDYQTDREKYLDKIQAEQLKIKQHEKDIQSLIAKALKKHGLKRIDNGGEIELGEVVVGQKHSKPEQYQQFLRKDNIAYYMDFSDYIVTQEISASSYMLQHVADYYSSIGNVNTFPIIFHSKQRHYEQDYLSPTVVIYQGIKSYQNVYGQRKQAIFVTEL